MSIVILRLSVSAECGECAEWMKDPSTTLTMMSASRRDLSIGEIISSRSEMIVDEGTPGGERTIASTSIAKRPTRTSAGTTGRTVRQIAFLPSVSHGRSRRVRERNGNSRPETRQESIRGAK